MMALLGCYFLVIGEWLFYFLVIGDWKIYFLVMDILEWYSLAVYSHCSTMAAPLWRPLICQTKSDCMQAVAQELVKILIFYHVIFTCIWIDIFI